MCRACLDLVEDIEQLESMFESRLGDMWNLLRSAGLLIASSNSDQNDAIHMAALAAGIIDDENNGDDHPC